MYDEKKIQEFHDRMLYPTVRVRTEKAGGSGTIIYSKPTPKGKGRESYVLTNCHVVDDNIKVATKWSTLYKREVKTDVLSECSVELFEFEYGSWESGHSAYNAEIMCYDKDMDLALLKIKAERPFDHVATLFPQTKHKERLRMFMKVFVVGCGMGHPPLVTEGHLTGFTDIIDNYPYWMSTAPTIFGTSGGACFLLDTCQFIGVPSRITVRLAGFSTDAITHMMYFIPITSVYQFLEEQVYMFIYDDSTNSDECAEIRKKKRERDEKMRAVDVSREGDEEESEGK